MEPGRMKPRDTRKTAAPVEAKPNPNELHFRLMALDACHAEDEFRRAFSLPAGIEKEAALMEVRHRCKRIAESLRYLGRSTLLSNQAG
jgi:hypothetical protein